MTHSTLESAVCTEQRDELAPFSLDHSAGAGQHGCRHIEAECLGRVEIDDQLELCRLLDRQITRLLALKGLPAWPPIGFSSRHS